MRHAGIFTVRFRLPIQRQGCIRANRNRVNAVFVHLSLAGHRLLVKLRRFAALSGGLAACRNMSRLRQLRSLCTVTAIVVMVQLLVVMAMASSGGLHQRLHDHAGEAGHECAVTLMLQGGYDTVVPDIVPVDVDSPPPLEPVVVLADIVAVPSHLVGGVLAQAPPRGP